MYFSQCIRWYCLGSMNYDPKDKVVLVTGGADGLGLGIADNFLQNGAKIIIILDIDENKGIETENNLNIKYGNGKAIFIKCDVTKDLEITKNIFEQYHVNVLVNSAGILNESEPRKTIEVNATSLVECSMKFWEYARIDKGGRGGTIINVGSAASYLKDDPFLVFYRTSKFAVMGFTKALGHRTNFEQFGVRVIIICPGMTDTKLVAKQICWDEHVEGFKEMLKGITWQTTDIVGKAVVNIYKNAESASVWSIRGGVVAEVV